MYVNKFNISMRKGKIKNKFSGDLSNKVLEFNPKIFPNKKLDKRKNINILIFLLN